LISKLYHSIATKNLHGTHHNELPTQFSSHIKRPAVTDRQTEGRSATCDAASDMAGRNIRMSWCHIPTAEDNKFHFPPWVPLRNNHGPSTLYRAREIRTLQW